MKDKITRDLLTSCKTKSLGWKNRLKFTRKKSRNYRKDLLIILKCQICNRADSEFPD